MEHLTNHDPFEEVKFISPFISHRLSCEIEHPSTPSLELEPCPSGHQNIVLDSGQDSTLPLHNISCKKENSAMDIPVAPTLESKRKDSTYEHESFIFETPFDSCSCCSLLESPEFVLLRATCFYEDRNHLLILISKLFRRMVVDAYVYQKYCKSYSCTMALTLQLER